MENIMDLIKNKDEVIGISKFKRNDENPFLKLAVEQVNNNLVKKFKTASNTGESAILQAIDEKTGEVLGHTSFIRQIEVDEDKFAKIYLSQFSAFFELKSTGLRVFGYIINNLMPNKDYFFFDMEECINYTGYKSNKSPYIGLAELLSKGLIARSKSEVKYYINPMLFFNGNRITFAKTYVKKAKTIINDNPNQLSLLDEIKSNEDNFNNETFSS